jgi:hypothetical protein
MPAGPAVRGAAAGRGAPAAGRPGLATGAPGAWQPIAPGQLESISSKPSSCAHHPGTGPTWRRPPPGNPLCSRWRRCAHRYHTRARAAARSPPCSPAQRARCRAGLRRRRAGVGGVTGGAAQRPHGRSTAASHKGRAQAGAHQLVPAGANCTAAPASSARSARRRRAGGAVRTSSWRRARGEQAEPISARSWVRRDKCGVWCLRLARGRGGWAHPNHRGAPGARRLGELPPALDALGCAGRCRDSGGRGGPKTSRCGRAQSRWPAVVPAAALASRAASLRCCRERRANSHRWPSRTGGRRRLWRQRSQRGIRARAGRRSS